MEIKKRKEFFYLQHVSRKEKKIVSKEIYLGKKIPKNIEKLKEKFLRQIQGDGLFKKFDLVKKNYQKEWKKYPESIKNKIMQNLIIEFTYNTNAIEGSSLTKDETNELIKHKISPNKPLQDVCESMFHANLVFDIIDEKYEDLSLELIKKWHKIIFGQSKKDIAGEIRDYLVKVGDYICPDWQDLKKLLREFFRWYNKEKKKLHPIELAAKAHFKFVKIHPFGDGNGRISRLIMNFILLKYGFPIMIIEYKKRISYYKALRNSDRKKTDWEFMKYFYRRYLKNYKKYLRKNL